MTSIFFYSRTNRTTNIYLSNENVTIKHVIGIQSSFLKSLQNKKDQNLFEMPTKNNVFFSTARHLKQKTFLIFLKLELRKNCKNFK